MPATRYIDKPLVFSRPGGEISDRLDVHFNEPRWDEFDQSLDHVLNSFDHMSLDKAVEQFNVGLTTAATKYYSESGVIFLRGENVYERHLDLNSQTFVPLERHKEWKSSQVKSGDIVINLVGNIGDACIIPIEIEHAQINRALGRIIPNTTIASAEYIMEFLNSEMGKGQLIRYSQGGMQRRFNHPDGIYVRVPILNGSQEKVLCERLRGIYGRIDKAREVIAESLTSTGVLGIRMAKVFCQAASLREYPNLKKQKILLVANSLNSDRLTFKFNQENKQLFFWKTRSNEARLGTFSDYAEVDPTILDPASIDAETFNYVDISSIDVGLKKIIKSTKVSCSDAPSRARRKLTCGNILISTVRPQRGAFAIITNEFAEAIGSTGFCQLKPKSDVPLALVFFLLFTNIVSRQMDMLSTGASYPAITEEDLQSIIVPIVQQSMQGYVIDECTEILRDFHSSDKGIQEQEDVCNRIINLVKKNIFSVIDDSFYKEISRSIDELESSLTKIVGEMQ